MQLLLPLMRRPILMSCNINLMQVTPSTSALAIEHTCPYMMLLLLLLLLLHLLLHLLHQRRHLLQAG